MIISNLTNPIEILINRIKLEYFWSPTRFSRTPAIFPIDCLDIMNIIGPIVVAGNVRRSAQIAIGDYDDLQYIRSKRWDLGNIPNWPEVQERLLRGLEAQLVVQRSYVKGLEILQEFLKNG